ncbi:MAG: hypothetical protein LC115_00390 [Bacteroidia bacterium]|nr:hypothetical protein [Bacteroidia bacterium]
MAKNKDNGILKIAYLITCFFLNCLYSTINAQHLVLKDSAMLSARGKVLSQDTYGNIYLLTQKNQLCKLFSTWDSVYCIGGRGTSEEALLDPNAICATSQQSIYVLDAAPRRIVLFNYNLKPAREVRFIDLENDPNFTENPTIIPKSFVVGPGGDLFLLNSFDNKILKFNSNGRLDAQFGGVDYGQGRLLSPNELYIAQDYTVWVTDTLSQQIIQFDYYGTWIQNWKPAIPFKWNRAKLSEKKWLFWNEQYLTLYQIDKPNTQNFQLPCVANDLETQQNSLILLNNTKIYRLLISK